SGFASPVQNVSEQSEVASSNLRMTLIDVYEHVVSFFRPMTCQYKDEKTLIPCHIGEGHNTTVCLENKCCPSEISPALTCYMPFTDKMQMTFRLLLLVAGGLLLLGCLPLCCCVCLQRSPCINPLRRGNKKLRKIVSERKAHSEDVSIPLLG
ncbi:FMR1N protein, partial [Bucorvus abyssinicus]|nr:FMR1N protein [Bucorvus abyssinicus]